MKIKIALIVGSNGKAAVSVVKADEVPDWGFMADCIMDYEKGSEPKEPEASAKYFVEVDVAKPKVESAAGLITPAVAA